VLKLILDDGQAFRWHALADGTWLGFWSGHAARLRLTDRGQLACSLPEVAPGQSPSPLHAYLALGTDFAAAVDRLPWRSDAHLKACIEGAPGLRLLHQPFGETLLCFLCSSTKRIPQIKLMAEALAARLGVPLVAPAQKPALDLPLSFHRLPTWEELAYCDESELRACGLGFRARHVSGTARFLAEHPGWLEETRALEYPEAHDRLTGLPGVGAKIADCVLLYGGARFEAFPVDTWILKVMARRYALEGWAPAAVAQFGRAHFGPQAGLAQQYLFNYERRERT
jgi:N-glycosylase/DNA lyase